MKSLKIYGLVIALLTSLSATEFPTYEEGESHYPDRSYLEVQFPHTHKKGEIWGHNRSSERGQPLEIKVPNPEEKKIIFEKMDRLKYPHIPEDHFYSIRKIFTEQKVEGISGQSTLRDLWMILLHNHFYVRPVNNANKGYVIEYCPGETDPDENEDITYIIGGEGSLIRYKKSLNYY